MPRPPFNPYFPPPAPRGGGRGSAERRLLTLSGILIALALALAVVAGGCGGEWGQFSKHMGDVTVVRKGWRTSDLMIRLGEPVAKNYGRNTGMGWEEWIYPTGSVYVYRMRVVKVEHRPKNAIDPNAVKRQHALDQEVWQYRDPLKDRDPNVIERQTRSNMEGFLEVE